MSDEKTRYPQIPSKVWWNIREKFKKSPSSTITESFLSIELDVQATAAKAYLAELRSVGLIDDEGKPTEIAKKWRLDETYAEAVRQMLEIAYPEELIDIAPPGSSDRQKASAWFEMTAGLGAGAAGNKAATYFLISTPNPPDEAPVAKTTTNGSKKTKPVAAKSSSITYPNESKAIEEKGPSTSIDAVPLNVNVQIHISADASSEQIESIFANMKKYLR